MSNYNFDKTLHREDRIKSNLETACSHTNMPLRCSDCNYFGTFIFVYGKSIFASILLVVLAIAAFLIGAKLMFFMLDSQPAPELFQALDNLLGDSLIGDIYPFIFAIVLVGILFIIVPVLPWPLLERIILQFKQANNKGKSIYCPSVIYNNQFIKEWYLDDRETMLICPNCGKEITLRNSEWGMMVKSNAVK